MQYGGAVLRQGIAPSGEGARGGIGGCARIGAAALDAIGWNGLMRPCGLNMNTRTFCLPRMAYCAALPVSPEVAPRILSCSPRRSSSD
jgi:hypothetical protein